MSPIADAREDNQKSCRSTNAVRSAAGPSLRLPVPASSSTAFAWTRSWADPELTIATAPPRLLQS